MQAVLIIITLVSYLPHALAPGAWSALPDIPVPDEIQDHTEGIGDVVPPIESSKTTDESGCNGQQMPVFPPVASGSEIALPHLTYLPRAFKSLPDSTKATLLFAKAYGYVAMDPSSVLENRALSHVASPIKPHAPPFFATHHS